jgi:hypothetical protein
MSSFPCSWHSLIFNFCGPGCPVRAPLRTPLTLRMILRCSDLAGVSLLGCSFSGGVAVSRRPACRRYGSLR